MGDWFKRRLQAVEGNATYAAAGWLVATYAATYLPIEAFKTWLHRPVSNYGILMWSFVPVLLSAIMFLLYRDKTPSLQVEIEPSSGSSQNIYLSVTNAGKTTILSAFCEVTGHPNGCNDYRRGQVRLGWEGGVGRQMLVTGETANLLIASFEDVVKFDLLQLNLWQMINDEKTVWNSARWSQHPNEVLPGFDLKIRIVGENTRSPKTVAFTVRPRRYNGPLELLQVGSMTSKPSDEFNKFDQALDKIFTFIPEELKRRLEAAKKAKTGKRYPKESPEPKKV